MKRVKLISGSRVTVQTGGRYPKADGEEGIVKGFKSSEYSGGSYSVHIPSISKTYKLPRNYLLAEGGLTSGETTLLGERIGKADLTREVEKLRKSGPLAIKLRKLNKDINDEMKPNIRWNTPNEREDQLQHNAKFNSLLEERSKVRTLIYDQANSNLLLK